MWAPYLIVALFAALAVIAAMNPKGYGSFLIIGLGMLAGGTDIEKVGLCFLFAIPCAILAGFRE